MESFSGASFDLEESPSPRPVPKTPPTPTPCAGVDDNDMNNDFMREQINIYKRKSKDLIVRSHSLHGATFDLTLSTPPPSRSKSQRKRDADDD